MKIYPENLKYTTDHEWLNAHRDEALVGITAFAAGELGDLVYIELEPAGTHLNAGEIFGTVEAVKTVSDLFMPVSGTIIAVNPLALSEPENVHTEIYGEAGWLIRILPDNAAAIADLMDRDAYLKLIGHD